MAKVTRADVQSITPEAWANMLQPALRKSLVASSVLNTRFSSDLAVGDTLHYSYFSGDNTVIDYADTVGYFGAIEDHEELKTTGETLVIDKQPLLRKKIDNIEKLYTNIDAQLALADEAGYNLKDWIDQKAFEEIENADAALNGGDPITLSTTNVISTFTSARRQLREANVEEDGTWLAVVTPAVAEQIELKATDSGFSVADAVFKNGYAGSFLGFKIYMSNNLPEKTVEGDECDTIYVGRQGMIHMAMKSTPGVKIADRQDSLGAYMYFWSVVGFKTFDRYGKRFLKGYIKKDNGES